MIYKDVYSQYDAEFLPYNRNEDCLNCGQEYTDHDGWRCYNTPAVTDGFGNISGNFSDYLPTDKYLTQSMKDSIMVNNTNNWLNYHKNLGALSAHLSPFFVKTPTIGAGASPIYMNEPAHQTAKPTIDQWQAWAHNQPGDCACGIKREACDYHR